MLKIQQSLWGTMKTPALTALFVLGGVALFSYLTFMPTQTFAEPSVNTPVYNTPDTRTLTNITYMQDMSGGICERSAENETKQLIDKRDGKKYWVTKLADGNCWMTQNLDYDIKAGDFIGAVATMTGDINTGWSGTQTEVQSWDPGTYYYKYVSATDWTSCGNPVADMAGCPSKGNWSTAAPAAEGEHYHVGNYYSWNAATAGTGSTLTSGEASASICPTGWKLPTSNNTTKGSFGYLMGQYGLRIDDGSEANVDKVRLTPLYFIPAGYVHTDGLNSTGYNGYVWSSSVHSNGVYAYNLYFASDNLYPSNSYYRYLGFSVRCVADPNGADTPTADNPLIMVTVNPVLTLDVATAPEGGTVTIQADSSKVMTGSFTATVSSNQAYTLALSAAAGFSTSLTTTETREEIPTIADGEMIVAGKSAWGIRTCELSSDCTETSTKAYQGIVPSTATPKIFYTSDEGVDSKDTVFQVGIAVDSSLSSGIYATNIVVTAAQI